jgi:hypothetical protein
MQKLFILNMPYEKIETLLYSAEYSKDTFRSLNNMKDALRDPRNLYSILTCALLQDFVYLGSGILNKKVIK